MPLCFFLCVFFPTVSRQEEQVVAGSWTPASCWEEISLVMPRWRSNPRPLTRACERLPGPNLGESISTASTAKAHVHVYAGVARTQSTNANIYSRKNQNQN